MATRRRIIPGGAEDDSDELAEEMANKLKITVVGDKSIGAGLDGKDFDKTLSHETNSLMDAIITFFRTYHNQPATKLRLKDILSQDPLPHRLALKLYLKCPQTNNSSLVHCVLSSIKMLANEKPLVIDDDTRMVAFNLFKAPELKFIDIVCDVYDLRSIAKLLKPKVKDLIKNGHYEAAAKWAINLGITTDFEIPELLFPLVLQDSVSILLAYLNRSPTLQRPTLEFLDQLLDRKMTPYQKSYHLFEKYNYKNVSSRMLQSSKPLLKLISLLCKRLKFRSVQLPNHTFLHTLSSFRHFFNDYIAEHMSVDSFKELLEAKADTLNLQIAFVEDISCSHPEEAIFWAKKFKLPVDKWPTELEIPIKCLKPGREFLPYLHRRKKYDKGDKFLKLAIKNENVKFVDNEKLFSDMLNDLECQNIVTFDSEWDPIWTLSDKVAVALLQLATTKNVYLIDCLIKDFHTKMWGDLERRVLNNRNILKIGYDIPHDISALESSLPLFKVRNKCSYLDMKQFNAYLKSLNIVFPYEDKSVKFGGLSNLVFECLGKPLDKSNKISKWTRRPLRHDQVMYAALDAYCLIQIYYVIDNLLKSEHIDINIIIDNMNNGIISYDVLNRHNQQKVQLQPQLHAQLHPQLQPQLPPQIHPVFLDQLHPQLQDHLRPYVQAHLRNQSHNYNIYQNNANGSKNRRQRINKNKKNQSK